jgi:hypothetical protein
MSNVVQFLEALARDPKQLSQDEYKALVFAATLNPAIERALLDGDMAALNRALKGRTEMACLIFPAEDQPNDDEDKHQEEEETPEQEPSALAA